MPDPACADLRADESAPRARIRRALVELVVARGYENTTVDLVAAGAAVSRADFELHFRDLEDCMLQVYDEINTEFARQVTAAYEGGSVWRDSLRAAAYSAADFFAEHPAEVRFCTTALLGAGELLVARRDRWLQRFVELVDAGRFELPDPDAVGRGVAEGAFGAIFERLLRDTNRGLGVEDARLIVPELMYLAVRPYVGHQAALEELSIPPPPKPAPEQGRTQTDTEVSKDREDRYAAVVPTEGEAGEGSGGLSRLPQGRHGLPRDFVVQNQIDRLINAMIATVARLGYHETTVALVCDAAGVSRRTFYEHYSDKQECFFATYEVVAEHLFDSARAAAAVHEGWPEQTRARIGAALEVFAANPDLVRFYLIAPQRAGAEIAERSQLSIATALAELTRNLPDDIRRPPAAVQSAALGGLLSMIVAKVEAGEGEALPELLPDLTELFLAPFIGREQAAAVAQGD